MFENLSSSEPGVRIGRIAFVVVAALPVVAFLHVVFSSGGTKDEQFSNFVLGILSLLLSLFMTVLGAAILTYVLIKRLPSRFWIPALFFAALPLLYWLTATLVGLIVGHPAMLR